jgi:hypothetical protein
MGSSIKTSIRASLAADRNAAALAKPAAAARRKSRLLVFIVAPFDSPWRTLQTVVKK